MKNTILSRVAVLLTVFAVFMGFNTCNWDNLALGSSVDITFPTIKVNEDVEPGSFLTGTEEIILEIDDDMGIASVEVTYTYLKKTGLPPNETVEKINPPIKRKLYPNANGDYVFVVDTIGEGMEDGEFSFTVTAIDSEGKVTVTPPLIYTVKNNPPTITLQIPRIRTHSDGSVNNEYPPSVVTDNYLMGVFEDLAGVAKNYPLIKFWEASKPEPKDFRENAGWEKVSEGFSGTNRGGGWVRADEFALSESGERGGSIRYYLRTRNAFGKTHDDKGNPLPGEKGLDADRPYKLKIYAEDINGIEIEWPRYLHPDGKKPDFDTTQYDDFMLIDLVAFGIPPQVTIFEPDGGTYHNKDFNIKASAKAQGDLDTDIVELCFEITGGIDKDGNKLPLRRDNYGTNGPIVLKRFVTGIGNDIVKDFIVQAGATYYTTEENDEAVILESGKQLSEVDWVTAVTLEDGSYNINVFARGNAHSRHTESRAIYIDRNPPRTEISRVSPAYSQDASSFTQLPATSAYPTGREEYRVFTVNKTIQIDVSATDTFGSAKDEATGYTKFKYLLFINDDYPGYGSSINDPLNNDNGFFSRDKYVINKIYSHNSAKFLDEGKNPVITEGEEPVISVKEDGGAYTITLRTELYDPEPVYNLWLYITAVDGAGNPNFQKILLKVDQNTDKPRITFGNVNKEGSPHGLTFMDDLFHIRFTVLDDNGLAPDAIEIRYAVNEDQRDFWDTTDGSGWHPLSGTPSEDGLSISIDDLNLLKIACFLDGHAFVTTHTLDSAHKTRLGGENDKKFIQIRAKDDPKTKVYESDGTSWGETEWRPFRLDLTKPKIIPSTRDASNSGAAAPLAGRTEDNPFGSPVKEGSYRDNLNFAYGDLVEQNLRSITVKINGNEVIRYPLEEKKPDPETGLLVDVLPDMDNLILKFGEMLPNDNVIAVWRGKPDLEWAGELRFRIPIGSEIAKLGDGSHSFEITFEDKALQNDTRSITIYKDMTGPEVNMIIPSIKYAANDSNSNGVYDAGEIPDSVLGDLEPNRIKEINAKIIGNFNDRYSSIFNTVNHSFDYKINNGSWIPHPVDEDNYNKSLVTWEIELPPNLLDGTHYLSVIVRDVHGNTRTESNLAFMLDRSQPKLTVTSITLASQNSKQGFTVKGKVTDTFSYNNNDFHVLVNQNSKAKTGDHSKVADREFEFEYFVETEGVPSVNDGYLADFKYGPNTILFNVTGSSGQSAIATGSIILDNKGPDITFNTTGGEKITLSSANVNTINTTNASGWTDANLKVLYDNRVKDRSAFARLSGRFTDEYTPIPQAGSNSFTFEWIISSENNYNDSGLITTTASTAESTSAGWDISIPTNMPDGIYYLTVNVKDRAGNQSADGNNMAFMVDRSIPDVSISIAGGTVPEYDVFSAPEMTNKTVTVTVTNTYEVQNFTFNVNNEPMNVTPTSSLKTFTYTYTFPDATGLIHGLQNISIAATGSSDQIRNASRGFNLDRNAPVISIAGKDKIYETQLGSGNSVTSINTGLGNGTINPRNWSNSQWGSSVSVFNVRLRDTTEKLTLNFTDDLSPISASSLSYRINSGTWTPITPTISDNNKVASVDIPWSSAAYREGLNTLNVRIGDTKGNNTLQAEYDQNIVFMVDTRTPLITDVTGIALNQVYGGNEVINISGVVKNTYDVSRISLLVNTVEEQAKGTETLTFLDYNSTAGGFPFTLNVSNDKYASLVHGTQSILINATGTSGKTAMQNYNVVIDREGPSITFNTTGSPIYINDANFVNVNNLAYGNAPVNAGTDANYDNLRKTSVKDVSAKLMGTFTDEHSAIFAVNSGQQGSYWYKIDRIANNVVSPGQWREIDVTSDGSTSVNWQIDLDSIGESFPDGLYRLSMRVQDRYGNGVAVNGQTSGSAPDNGGHGYQNNMTFLLDRTPPTLVTAAPVVTLGGSNNSKKGYTFTGTISNTFDVSGFQILAAQNNKIIFVKPTQITNRSFSYSYWVQTEDNNNSALFATDFVYGPNTILLSATGSSGQSSIVTSSITLDNKGPDVTFSTTGGEKIELTSADLSVISTTNAASWTGNNLKNLYDNRVKDRSAYAKLSGRFADDYTPIPQVGSGGTYTFNYTITGPNNYNETHVISATAATVDSMSAVWDIPIPTNMADGIYYLSIHVNDREHNQSTGGNNMAFMVDRSIPDISINVAGGNNNEYDVFNANDMTGKTVTVTVTNTYEVQNFTFNVNNAPMTVTPTSSLKTFTYTYTFADATGLDHGLQNISVAATGSSDQTRNLSRGFNLDITAPVISISGQNKVFENQLGAGNSVTTINTGLGDGSVNPRTWSDNFDNLASVYNVRLKDITEKLTLNFTDDLSPIKADSLSYRINSTGSWIPLSPVISDNNKVASAEIKLSDVAHNNGLNTLNVKISDTKLNETPFNESEQNIIFMVDTLVPSFIATNGNSTVEGIKVNQVFGGDNTIKIRGVVRNVYDVSRLGLIVNAVEKDAKGTETGYLLYYAPDAVKGGFQFEFDVPTSSFSHGTQSIIINAIGSSGKSAMLSYNIVVDKEGPSITFSTTGSPIYVNNVNFAAIHGYAYGIGTMNPTQENEYRPLYASRITDTGGRLTGTFTDEHSEIFAPNPVQGDAYGYWYKIDRINAAGSAIEEGAWRWEHVASPPANNFANWQITLDSSYPDGLYRLSMRAKDRLGNGDEGTDDNGKGYQNNMTFMLDRTAPTLSVEKVTQGHGPIADGKNNINGVYVTGKISNTFEVKGLNVVVAQDDKEIFGIPPTVPGDPTIPRKSVFSYDYWVQIEDDADFVYGPNTMVVSASGSSGQSDMKTTSTIIDNRGPEISFNTTGGQKVYVDNILFGNLNSENISAATWNDYRSNLYDTRVKDSSATAKLTGRFSDDYSPIPDNSGNYTFRYKITGDSAWTDNEWKPLTMSSSMHDARSVPWEVTLPVTMPDGIYRLSIAVKDRNGFGSDGETNTQPIEGINYGYEADMAFMVNRKAPMLALTDLDGYPLSQTQIFNAYSQIDFKGTVTGTYAVNNLRLTKTDGTNEELLFTQTGQKTFTINSKTLQNAVSTPKLDHGEQNIQVSLTGSSDLASSVPYRFVVDTEGPVVEIRGREKILETALISSTAGRDAANVNNGLANGENPNLWGDDSLYTIFHERMTDHNTKLTLTFFDNFSTIASSYSYNLNGSGWTTASIPPSNITNNGRNAFVDIPWYTSGGNDGLNVLSIRISDDKTNQTQETDIIFMVDAKTPIIDGTAIIGNAEGGVYSGSSNIKITGYVEAVYAVNRIDFIFDGTEITALGSDVLYAGPLPPSADEYLYYDTVNKRFNFGFTLPGSAYIFGTKNILINASGTSGKSAMFSKNIIIDNMGPSITFNTTSQPIYLSDSEFTQIQGTLTGNPALNDKYLLITGNAIYDQSARLMGNFMDDYSYVFSPNPAQSGQSGYYYKIDKLNSDNTITSGTWLWESVTPSDSTTAGWSIPLTSNNEKYGFDFEDGFYRLSIRVKDRLNNGYDNVEVNGNSGGGFQNNMAFYMERSIPQIKITSVVPQFTNKGFEIKGEVWNASVKSLSVSLDGNEKYKYTAETGNTGSVTVTSLGADSETKTRSSFTVQIQSADLTVEKTYPVMISVLGGSGQSNMTAANFTFDKTAPSGFFNMPNIGTNLGEGNLSNNGKYSIALSQTWVNGSTKVGGTSEDNNGIDKIYYRFGNLTQSNASGITSAAYHLDGANDAAREANYDSPITPWLDTKLDGSANEFAAGWTGGLYNWTYTADMNDHENSIYREENFGGENTITGENSRAFFWPMYVKIIDRAGNITILHYKLKVDPDADRPLIEISDPKDERNVGGEVRVQGTAGDDDRVHSVEIRITPLQFFSDENRFTLIGGTRYYKNAEDEWAYPNEFKPGVVAAENMGWIKTKIQGTPDTLASWFYSINGDGLLSPPANQLRSVKIEARSLDTKDSISPDIYSRVYTITAIFDSSVPTINTPEFFKGGVKIQDYSDNMRLSESFTIRTYVEDEGGISKVSARQIGDPADTVMVENGQVAANLNPLWRVTSPDTLQHTATWESGWRYYIINPGTNVNWSAIDAAPQGSSKTYGAGTMIQYNGNAKDGSGSVVLKANAGTRELDTSNANANSNNWNSQRFRYHLEFDVNSTTLPNLGYGKTGIYTLSIRVEDNNTAPAPYVTNGLYTVGIDNYYPGSGNISTYTAITTQYNASTANFTVSGLANDNDSQSGSIAGIARVLVYFSRQVTGQLVYKGSNVGPNFGTATTVYFNPRGVPIGYLNGTNFISFNVQDAFYATVTEWSAIPVMTTRSNVLDKTVAMIGQGYAPNVASFSPFPVLAVRNKGTVQDPWYVWESPHAMVIDYPEFDSDTDGDGTTGELWEGRSEKEWQARFDTRNFADGPVDVHYIVMDEAGNSTHHSKKMYVGNNRPLVRDINLGTDMGRRGNPNASAKTNTNWGSSVQIYDYTASRGWGDRLENPMTVTTGSDTVSTDIFSNTGVLTTNFRIKNYAFNVVLNTLFGNGQKRYRVSYVTNRAPIHPSAMVVGQVYTIMQPGNIDWRQYGSLDNNAGTTFIATDKPDASVSGQVYSYTLGTGNAERAGNFTAGGDNTADKVSNIIFNNFTGITDSDKITAEGTTKGDIITRNQRFFLIKVYDSTTGTSGAEIDQLAHAFAIALDIDNDDGKRPSISVSPFYWESASRNSLFNNSRSNGHIELEGDLAGGTGFSAGGTSINDLDPKVSGQVSIRGTSFDNNVVADINFRITNHTQQAAQQTNSITVGANTYYRAATYTNGAWDVPVGPFTSSNQDTRSFNASGWKFVIESDTLNMDGHTVNWRLDFDSSFIYNIASADNVFTIVARDSLNDSNPRTWTTNLQTAETVKTEHYRFDIVPYIREVVTPLSLAYKSATSAFNRSATGWYPVRDSKTTAEKIGIKGFNLDGATMTISVNGTNLNGRATAVSGDDMFVSSGTASNPASTAKTHVVARMDNDATLTNDSQIQSGALLVTVNSMTSLNNRNNNAAGRVNGEPGTGYNDEPNNINNNILNDDRNMYVWSVGSLLNKTTGDNRITLESPSFVLGETGRRLLAHANYTVNPGAIVLHDNGDVDTRGTILETNLNRYAFVTVAVDSGVTGGNNEHWYVGANNQTSNGRTAYNLHSRGATGYTGNNTSEYGNMYPGLFKTRILGNRVVDSDGSDSNRIRMAKIHSRSTTTNNNSRITVSYGDSLQNNNVYLHYGTANGTSGQPLFAGDLAPSPTENGANASNSGTANNRGYDFPLPWTTTTVAVGTKDNTNNNTFTSASALNLGATGSILQVTVNSTSYWLRVISESANTFRLYNNINDATAGTAPAGQNAGAGNGGTVTATVAISSPIPWQNARLYAARPQAVATSSTNYKGSMYTASASLSNNVPVIAWYDETSEKLLISYGNVAQDINNANNVTTTDVWQARATEVQVNAGPFVDMAVDGGNNVHLAYYDNNGGLCYAYIPSGSIPVVQVPGTSTTNKITGITTFRVDTFLSAGLKIMINVRQETHTASHPSGAGTRYVPYISYYHGAFPETKFTVRTAWPVTFTGNVAASHGTDDLDFFTGNWEVMTVPVDNLPLSTSSYNELIIANGVPRTSDNWIAPSNSVTGTPRALSAYGYTGSGTNRKVHRTILVGYMTLTHYEGAILKKDLW